MSKPKGHKINCKCPVCRNNNKRGKINTFNRKTEAKAKVNLAEYLNK